MREKQNHIEELWTQPESRRLEFKEQFPGGKQLAKTSIAFSNGGGGKIVFGVRNDPREVVGIANDKLFKLEERIANHILDNCEPAIVPEIYIQAVEGKTLLVVEIFSGPDKPYYIKSQGKDNGVYIRVGSTTRQASQEMIQTLELRRRNISFDALPVYDASIAEVSLDTFKADYTKTTGRTLNEERLTNLGLLHDERSHILPTHGAVLLSGSPIRKRYFPYAKIECARFKGTDTGVFLDQMTINGPIHATVEPCLSFIKKNIALSAEIGEVYREERWEYPLEAVREAITNAVIHRDYSVLGNDTRVAIFDDMLEITSPGQLPETLSVEELGTGRSEIRNRVLAPIFKDLNLIEAWGTGFQRMRKALEKYPEVDLILQEVGYAFQVQFRKRMVDRTSTGQVPDKYRTSILQDADKIKLLKYCREARLLKEMMRFMKLKHRETFMNNYLRPLLEVNCIAMTIPDKPNNPSQQYIITQAGEALLNK